MNQNFKFDLYEKFSIKTEHHHSTFIDNIKKLLKDGLLNEIIATTKNEINKINKKTNNKEVINNIEKDFQNRFNVFENNLNSCIDELFTEIKKDLNDQYKKVISEIDTIYIQNNNTVGEVQKNNDINKNISNLKNDINKEYIEIDEESNEKSIEVVEKVNDKSVETINNLEEKLNDIQVDYENMKKENNLYKILVPSLTKNKSIIKLTSEDIIHMSIPERINKLEELYQEFLLFSDLYGKFDLGIIPTLKDLEDIKNYKENIKVNKLELIKYIEENDNDLCQINWDEYERITDIVPESREYVCVYEYEGKAYFNNFCEKEKFIKIGNEGIDRVNEIKMVSYNNELERASSIEFPTEAFDKLVNQLNIFYSN